MFPGWCLDLHQKYHLCGTGMSGSREGSQAQFVQPTALCVEANSVFVTDSTNGRLVLAILSNADPLVKFLDHLHAFIETFSLSSKGQ